jgi:hypothetical protein
MPLTSLIQFSLSFSNYAIPQPRLTPFPNPNILPLKISCLATEDFPKIGKNDFGTVKVQGTIFTKLFTSNSLTFRSFKLDLKSFTNFILLLVGNIFFY